MKTAIVTGASSGLGSEFVRRIAEQEILDEIWVIARRKERMEALKEQVSVPLKILPLDLTQQSALQEIQEKLKEESPDVQILINAAGFGKIGSWEDISLEDSDNMINLNCRAAVDMTQIVLPYMQTGAKILEICSTAAFSPFPYLNVYAATKAFLYRYSRALRVELRGRGISVTAVCPYWIKDTEFIQTARKSGDSSYIRHFPLASRQNRVVRRALADADLRLAVSTPGPVCLLHRISAKIIPAELMMGIWALLRRI